MAELDLGSSCIPALYKPAALLPIAKHRESLLYLIETHPVTIVVGQTGSGKTTQLPQFLEQAGWCADGKVIGITQVSLARGRSAPLSLPMLTCSAPSRGSDDGCREGRRRGRV